VLTALAGAAVFGLVHLLAGTNAGAATIVLTPLRGAAPVRPFHSVLPEELRGVHVTGPLMSLPGKFQQYLALKKYGLNALEVDVKDEAGNVSFLRGAPGIAVKDGAA